MKDLSDLRARKKISEDDKTILDMVYFVLEEPLDLFESCEFSSSRDLRDRILEKLPMWPWLKAFVLLRKEMSGTSRPMVYDHKFVSRLYLCSKIWEERSSSAVPAVYPRGVLFSASNLHTEAGSFWSFKKSTEYSSIRNITSQYKPYNRSDNLELAPFCMTVDRGSVMNAMRSMILGLQSRCFGPMALRLPRICIQKQQEGNVTH